MKQLLTKTRSGKRLVAGISLLFLCYSVNAQNASYNANTVPITGTNCSAFGFQCLLSNTTGSNNIANGYQSLLSNTTGYDNTAIGYQALYSNTAAYWNVAIGSGALFNNTGNVNTAVGTLALNANTTGLANTAVGTGALLVNTTGQSNVAIGNVAMGTNTTGDANSANGYCALLNNTSGYENSTIGINSLLSNTTGYQNTSAGGYAMRTNVDGYWNTALGYNADVKVSNLYNATAIGYNAVIDKPNKMRLGDVNVHTVETETSFSTVSDGRFKYNINEADVKGLEFINLLRPVVYNFDSRKFQEFLIKKMPDSVRGEYLNQDFSASTALRQSGFIAQEVEAAAKKAGYNFNGVIVPESKDDNYGLAYSQFVVPLVKAVQELSKEVEELKAIIKANTNVEGSVKLTQTNTDAKLFQNSPNPFNQSTVIKYSIPATAKTATINIISAAGVKIKEFDLKNNKAQNIEIGGNQLAAGTYIYSLVIDGNMVDSKQMVLTR